MADPHIVEFLTRILILFFAIGIHEYAHCKFADMAGDPTPSYYGRVTLNLFKHFEPVGTMMILLTSWVGFGIGWGRPAPMNPRNMRNPRWDWFLAVIAGPLSNLAQAILFASLFRLATRTGILMTLPDQASAFVLILFFQGVVINLALFFFNLIPFGPLDGHWLVGLLLPEPARTQWFQFNRQVGTMGLFFVIIFLQTQHVSLIQVPLIHSAEVLLGMKLT